MAYGTMQDFPLTITTAAVSTGDTRSPPGEGYRHSSYRDVGQRRLASWQMRCAASVLPRTAGCHVRWNNTERGDLADGRGALHTLNIRLFPEQIAYVTRPDRILVDLSLAQQIAAQTRHRAYRDRGKERATRRCGKLAKTVLRFARW